MIMNAFNINSDISANYGQLMRRYFGRGVNFGGGGGEGASHDFEVKIKLHNTSIKSIFGITSLIYFRDISSVRDICERSVKF